MNTDYIPSGMFSICILFSFCYCLAIGINALRFLLGIHSIVGLHTGPKPMSDTPLQVAPVALIRSVLDTVPPDLQPLPLQAVPSPTPPPTTSSSYSGNVSSWLLSLRMCESGGNYQEDTGNGFYGAYQFTIATWDHWGTGYLRADLAPASVQDATILENTRASGAGLASQNPGCYAKEDLSAFPPSP
jgi:hypothetical protein